MRGALLLILGTVLVGCIGTTPDSRRQSEIGSDDEGPLHDPGHPCGLCHGEFVLAGTIYTSAFEPDGIDEHGNEMGLEGVRVIVTDARGREIEALTNPAGNFFFKIDGPDDGSFRIDDEGQTNLGFEPEFPLDVRITDGVNEQVMITPIRAEVSCAACHSFDPAADSTGRTFLMEPLP